MKKVEIIIAMLSVLALIMNLQLVPGGSMFTVLTLSTLSLLYLYLGFALFNDIKLNEIFIRVKYKNISTLRILGAIGTGISLSMTLIGLLFKFQSWPNADTCLKIGLGGLLVVLIIGIFKFLSNKTEFYVGIFIRVAIYGVLGLTLLSAPKTFWVELKYRNYPAYVAAYKLAITDPNNKELWENVEAERKKIFEMDAQN